MSSCNAHVLYDKKTPGLSKPGLMSERGDSNARPLRPERSALPTALLSVFACAKVHTFLKSPNKKLQNINRARPADLIQIRTDSRWREQIYEPDPDSPKGDFSKTNAYDGGYTALENYPEWRLYLISIRNQKKKKRQRFQTSLPVMTSLHTKPHATI